MRRLELEAELTRDMALAERVLPLLPGAASGGAGDRSGAAGDAVPPCMQAGLTSLNHRTGRQARREYGEATIRLALGGS
jgi:hypothetical protein